MLNLIKKRKNCCEFSKKKVSKNNINFILTAGRFAPSSHNAQDWTFVVVENKEKLQKIISDCCYGLYHNSPPVLVAVVANPLYEKEKPGLLGEKLIDKARTHKYLNIGFAADHMILAAESKGINSSIISPNSKLVDTLLKVPSRSETVLCIALGYEKKNAFTPRKNRKSAKQVVRYESYSREK